MIYVYIYYIDLRYYLFEVDGKLTSFAIGPFHHSRLVLAGILLDRSEFLSRWGWPSRSMKPIFDKMQLVKV